MSRLQLALDGEPDALPWTAAEFLGAKAVESFLAGAFFGVAAGLAYGFLTGAIVGPVAAFVVYAVVSSGPSGRMWARRKQVIRRLPYAVDLLALMMEAGATFTDGLRTLAREQQDHPIGREFARLLSELEHGETLRAALTQLQKRLPDEEDVSEFVFSIVKGQELGTPLAESLRNQADQMRLKRSQRAEKAAADAQVQMTGPGFAIMLVCMAIITAPFAMNFWNLVTASGDTFGTSP
jgi:tight adherence protein C